MKLEIKTRPVCVTIITFAALLAIIAIQVHGTRIDFAEGWYAITIITFIVILSIGHITRKL
jgi:hypothetical protein